MLRWTALVLLLLLPTIADAARKGKRCTSTTDCRRSTDFCHDGRCRRASCTVSSQCADGELCHYGKVDGRTQTACFPVDTKIFESKNLFCPGGKAVLTFAGKLETCDAKRQCVGDSVCNPQYGVCCSKLRTCPSPSFPLLDTTSRRPLVCRWKEGKMEKCPAGGHCESTTGFCCSDDPNEKEEDRIKSEETNRGPSSSTSDPDVAAPRSKTTTESTDSPVSAPKPTRASPASARPQVGQVCTPRVGCSAGAACVCARRGKCRCECPEELGYSSTTDGKGCERKRRRLKEKCSSDLECAAAFSECTTGGCRCKQGFQRDGKGGCKPVEYKCVGGTSPLLKDEHVVSCTRSFDPSTLNMPHRQPLIGDLVRLARRSGGGKNATVAFSPDQSLSAASISSDSCETGYYCVPVFDSPTQPGLYQGFCCPVPPEVKPVCPVGNPHESSSPPDFGCRDCPADHFCHRDTTASEKEICCPKACLSLEDVYDDGQCYPMAFHGDACHVAAQQAGKTCGKRIQANALIGSTAKLECIANQCDCPSGYSYSEGACRRILCMVGLRGEPSVDALNRLVRCERSADCAGGHLCDPNTRVCCRGTNRCPKGYVETGETCGDDDSSITAKGNATAACSSNPTDICFRHKDDKSKLCCRVEKD